MDKTINLTSFSQSPTENLIPLKSVRWYDQCEMVDLMNNENINLVDNMIPNGDAFSDVDFKNEEERDKSHDQDPLPLIEDLFMNSMEDTAHRSQMAANDLRSEQSKEEDEERQAALQELVTHLEDTAALLKQFMAPPNNDFVDNISKSEKTHFLLKYQLVFVIFNQLLSILILSIFDHFSTNQRSYVGLKRGTGAVLQLLNIMLVMFSTVVLSRQLLKSKVQSSFMAQTYIATVITFAGLYFVIYRFEPESWEFGSIDKMDESIAISQYVKMIYLSVSAATLCGAANIQPRTWYTIIILCFQSLINFVYFASILAQTIGNYNSYTVQVRRSNSMSVASARRTR